LGERLWLAVVLKSCSREKFGDVSTLVRHVNMHAPCYGMYIVAL